MGPQEAAVGRRLAAIFAADVAGYSRLMGQDEVGTLRALSAARATLGGFIAEYGGRLVNTVGDSALAEFASVVDAVQCAMAAQRKLADEPALTAEGSRLQFRIAVHVGDVMPSGTDIFGDGINVCARLQELAEPGGICVSGAAYQYVRKGLKVAVNDLGERRLKNIDEPVHVFAIQAGNSPQQPKPSLALRLRVASVQAKTRGLGGIAAGALAAAMALAVLIYQFTAPTGTTIAQQRGIEAAKAAASSSANVISIAVLPFENLSSDPEQEFFSDGMTEEITSALARVPDLRVVARTSAFEYKGKAINIKTMGQALGATHLIEGSVRKAGDRVRITVQLIRTDDGTHIWAEDYDRQLTDIFAIQEDIARAITASLRMPLGLKPGENLVNNRSIDAESYQQFLRAKPLVRALGRGVPRAIQLLEPLVARNLDYAPAWAQLSNAYGLTPNYHRNGTVAELRRYVDEFLPKAEAAAQRALQLDPNLADGYVALGRYQARSGRYLLAEQLFLKALALDANNPDALNQYGNMLSVLGRLKEALAMKQQMLALEPEIVGFKTDTAELLWLNGRDDAAIAILKESSSVAPQARMSLARIYAAMGRYGEAADAIMTGASGTIPPELLATAASLMRTAPAQAASPQSLPPLGTLGFVYLYIGAPDRVLENYEGTTQAGFFSASGTFNAFLFHSSYAALRKTERFKAWVRAEGYVDYWRAKGWPQWCHPTTGDDFACE